MAIDEDRIRDLIAKRQAAEKAVEGADPATKEKAFEVVLQHLLAADAQPVGKKRTRHRKTPPTESEKKRSGKRTRRQSASSVQTKSLVGGGFFNKWRTLPEVRKELRARGHSYEQSELSPILLAMTRDEILRREVKPGTSKKKKTWAYMKVGQ